jgi:hypothetical protein
MKKITTIFVIFCALFAFIEKLSFSQWEPDVRLTNNINASETSFNSSWCIAAISQSVHIAWFDNRGGSFKIFYKRSTDEGVTWETDRQLTSASVESRFPSLSIDGQTIHLVWRDRRDTSYEIYYKRSTDLGVTWGADIRLTNNKSNSLPPSMAVSGSFVHVVWYDDRDGNTEIYYKRSSDGGSTWGPDTRLTDDPFYSMQPTIAVFDSVIHVAWHDTRSEVTEIYYKRSSDGGSTWGDDIRLTDNFAESRYACLSASGKLVHLVWSDQRPNHWAVYYKRSSDEGITWSADTLLGSPFGLSEFSSMAVSGELVHVIWSDARNGNWEIYYKNSTNQGISWESDKRLTNAPGVSWFPSIAASGRMVHAMWSDFRDDNYEIYYSRDTTGNIVGINAVTGSIPGLFSLHQNYPNPFNPNTNIKFNIPKESGVRLEIFDAIGRSVDVLVDEKLNAGTYNVQWDGSGYSSGVYYYRIKTELYTETKKMLMVK